MLLFSRDEDAKSRGKLQTYIKAWREIGSAAGLIAGAPLWGLIGSKGVFGIISSFYLLASVTAIFINDSVPMPIVPLKDVKTVQSIEIDANGNPLRAPDAPLEPESYNCAYTLGGLHQAWLNNTLRPLLIFTIVTGLFPSPATPMFYFMNDQLKYTPNEMAIRATVSEIVSFMAVVASYKFGRFVSIRYFVGTCIVFKIVVGLIPLILIETVHRNPGEPCGNSTRNVIHWKNGTCYRFEVLNLDPLAITCFGDAIEDGIDAFSFFPLERTAMLLCSSMAQTTVYSFIMSMLNITGALRGVINSFFIKMFDVDHGQYENLPAFVLFCSFLDLLSLCVVPILPSCCVQDIANEMQRQKQVNEILQGEFSVISEAESVLSSSKVAATIGVYTSHSSPGSRDREGLEEEIL